jgi:hypothetical protein
MLWKNAAGSVKQKLRKSEKESFQSKLSVSMILHGQKVTISAYNCEIPQN